MSIAGYLDRTRPERRMPKNCGKELGARFEGVVLMGEKTVEEQLGGDVVRTEGPCYESVEEYDPVLRAHCRLPGVK
jgi:hypothetical protein